MWDIKQKATNEHTNNKLIHTDNRMGTTRQEGVGGEQRGQRESGIWQSKETRLQVVSAQECTDILPCGTSEIMQCY